MAQQEAQALIVAQTGSFTDGAHTLLATIPAVAGIAQVDDAATAAHALVGHDAASANGVAAHQGRFTTDPLLRPGR